MSHAAEGELHAWLDGALDQLGEERARELREHVRTCARCAHALAEEEGLRAHANEILALSAPAPSDLLPLETLLERARGRAEPVVAVEVARPRRVSRTAVRLGWAASVMVALGAGWMAREIGLRRDVAGVVDPVASLERTVEPVAAAVEAAAATEMAMAPTGPTVAVASPPPPSAPSVGETGGVLGGGAAASAVVASAEEEREEREEVRRDLAPAAAARVALADVVTAAERSAPPPAAPVAVQPMGGASALGLDEIVVSANAAAAPAPPPQSARLTETATSRAGNTARRDAPVRQERAASSVVADPAAGIGIQRARQGAPAEVPELFVQRDGRDAAVSWEADMDEARDLIVPSLTLLKVEWNELSPGRPSLRALHELDSGETLEVRWIRSGGARADAASDPLAELRSTVPEGWSQVIRVHRDGWLVGRAPISADALEALMKTAGTGR